MDHSSNTFNEIGSPGFISTKSSVFEDALEVQHRPFSAISSSSVKEIVFEKTVGTLGVISVVSTALSVLSVVLIIRFDFKQEEEISGMDSTGWGGKVWYNSLLDTGTVLSSFCVMLNLHCVIVCTSQCYFASKVLKLPQGEQRSIKYLKNTAGLRFFAVSSFAVSVPVFILALCSYLLLEFRLVAATVSSGLLVLGIFMIFFSFLHSVEYWRQEKKSVSDIVKPKFTVSHIDSKFAFCNHIDQELTDSNLSTLV